MVPVIEDLELDLGAMLDLQDDQGRTAVFTAAKEGNVEELKYLIGLGADINIVSVVPLSYGQFKI